MPNRECGVCTCAAWTKLYRFCRRRVKKNIAYIFPVFVVLILALVSKYLGKEISELTKRLNDTFGRDRTAKKLALMLITDGIGTENMINSRHIGDKDEEYKINA